MPPIAESVAKNPARRLTGFTLVEVLVVLTIVGVLAAIAYPSYMESVRKTRRAEGRAALMQSMQQQERYYTQHTTYVAFPATENAVAQPAFKWFSGATAATSAYELSATACEGETLQNCVVVHAVPGTDRVDGSFRDPQCGTLSLTSTGIQAAGAERGRCW